MYYVYHKSSVKQQSVAIQIFGLMCLWLYIQQVSLLVFAWSTYHQYPFIQLSYQAFVTFHPMFCSWQRGHAAGIKTMQHDIGYCMRISSGTCAFKRAFVING